MYFWTPSRIAGSDVKRRSEKIKVQFSAALLVIQGNVFDHIKRCLTELKSAKSVTLLYFTGKNVVNFAPVKNFIAPVNIKSNINSGAVAHG